MEAPINRDLLSKKELRGILRRKRLQFEQELSADEQVALFESRKLFQSVNSLLTQFATEHPPRNGKLLTLGGYWPLKGEFNVQPLLNYLSSSQRNVYNLCLPVTPSLPAPLVFKQWTPGDKLLLNPKFKMEEPVQESIELIPDALIIPLLGFDESCNRLGYGGGFYDRTIEHLQNNLKKPLLTIGIAFQIQLIKDDFVTIQLDPNDQPLDYVVTESNLYRKDK